MTTAKKKPGHKAKHHEFNGKRIEHRARCPSDGRWHVFGTSITFSELPAIAKFYALESGKQPDIGFGFSRVFQTTSSRSRSSIHPAFSHLMKPRR
jgi:hypothetical protein